MTSIVKYALVFAAGMALFAVLFAIFRLIAKWYFAG
jgi:hypothetical protein